MLSYTCSTNKRKRGRETERGEGERERERDREIHAQDYRVVSRLMVNPIVGLRSIDDRIGKKIVPSCQPLSSHRGGGGKRTRGASWFVGYRQIALSARVSSSIGRGWVEVGRDDHRSIRTGEGNEGGLERVISQVYIWWNERIRSCGRSCCDYCAFWIFEEFYSKMFRRAVDKTWFKPRVSLSLCLSLKIQDKFRRVE